MTVIAKVALDLPLSHLDQVFDYSVPEAMVNDAVVGARVRVRFAGRKLDGWITDLAADSEIAQLSPITKVVSAEPIMRPELVRLIRTVADHYAGTFSDVMRLAVPPRHARTEKAEQQPWPENTCELEPQVLPQYHSGASFLAALQRGRSPRAFWQVAPTASLVGDWAVGIAEAVTATRQAGKSALVLVPDERDVQLTHSVLAERFGKRGVGILHNGLGPSRRYRNYLAATRGVAKIMVGTRAAVFTPMPELGLIALWDDGDDLYAELHAPYPHARQVVGIRTLQQGNALLLAARGRSTEIQNWLAHNWIAPISMPATQIRKLSPVVRAIGDSKTDTHPDQPAKQVRLPSRAFEVLRAGLAQGPVLVQVPRAGYAVSLSCQKCRTPARCSQCSGPLRSATASSTLGCGWCGRLHPNWSCEQCHSRSLRAPKVGATRTAEELARAFPGVLAINSSGDRVRERVPDKPAIVVATPGGEPIAPTGYAAALLLDTEVLLSRESLRANEEALRKWLNAVGLVRPAEEGGTVVAVGDSAALQPLVRLDAAGSAEKELLDRKASGFPPAVKLVDLLGPPTALEELLDVGDWSNFERIGPAGTGEEDQWRLILRSSPDLGPQLVNTVKMAVADRTAHKRPGIVRVQVDPVEIG